MLIRTIRSIEVTVWGPVFDRFPFGRRGQTGVGTDELHSLAWPRRQAFCRVFHHSQTRQWSSQTFRSVTSRASHERVCAATLCVPIWDNKPEKVKKRFPRFINNRRPGWELEFDGQDRELGLKVRTNMAAVHPCQPILVPPHATHHKKAFSNIRNSKHARMYFCKNIAIAPPLTLPYDGPYKVISRSGRVIIIVMKGKVEMVTVDRNKPAHFERESGSGTTAQRQSTPKSKSTTPKPAAITCKSRKVRAQSSSTTTPKSLKIGVDTNMSTRTRSLTLGTGTSPALALQSDTTRARLPRPPTLYEAPHSRTTTVSCANVDIGSFQTYSHIPSHLHGNNLGRTETNTLIDVRNRKNTDHSGKAKADNTVK